MQLHISAHTKRSFSGVTVTHPGENDIVFSASGYASTKPGAVTQVEEDVFRVDLFGEVNEFIAKLPLEKQLALYECYARLDSIFQVSGFDPVDKTSGDNLDKMLIQEINRIYEIIRFEDLRDYVMGNTKIRLPPELSDEYVTSDKITPLYMQRTYRLSEYIDLVAQAMGLRFMIPVWGPYLPLAAKEWSQAMKEYYAFQLIMESRLYQSPVFERLEVYVRANLNEEEQDLSIHLKFLSSEEVPTYLIALAAIRKLSVAQLSAESDRDHLMKIIYNYILGDNTRIPATIGVKVTPKKGPGEVNMDDNSSVWCIFKMKEQLAVGDLVLFQIYVTDYVKAALAIEPEIDVARVEECVTRALALQNFNPREAQIGLCMQVMATVVPGCVIEMFDRATLMTSMGIAQAVLWHWNLPELAILMTAMPIELEEDEIMSPTAYAGLSEESLAALQAIYPYDLPEQRHNDQHVSPNAGVRGIETLVTDLYRNYWEPTAPRSLLASYSKAAVREMEVSSNIRDQLATLLIKLDEYIR